MYAAYLRKSRADMEAEARGEGETLARHRVMLVSLAMKNRHDITTWYQEIVSGESISDRPEMRRLLADVGAGEWEGIYVMEVERLARGDTSDQGRVAQAFLFSKTRIITPMKTYDPSNEFDTEYFEFALFMSRREYKTINRRIQAGRMQSIQEGKYICSRPAYGYHKVKIRNNKGFTLEITPHEAAVVRQIFHWYLHGDHGQRMGLTRIAHRLLDWHVHPGAQGSGWTPCRIYRILTNEVYIGKIRWGRVQANRSLTEAGIQKKLKMTRDYQLFDGLHEAIISEDDFFAVQGKQSRNCTPLQIGRQLANPLAGLVLCSGCKRAMRGKPAAGRQPAMLFCATHGCGTVRTARQEVEAAVLAGLRAWIKAYAPRADLPVPGPSTPASDLLAASLAKLWDEQKTIARQKARLHDLLEQGIYTPAMFAERMCVLMQKEEDTAAAISDIEKRRQRETKPAKDTAPPLLPTVRHIIDAYEAAPTAQEKNDLLKTVLDHVDYEKTVKGNQYVDPHQFEITLYPRIL